MSYVRGIQLSEEQRWLRMRAIQLAHDAGETFRSIGERHGISAARAQQLYARITWPTDVAERWREEQREKWES